MVSWPEFQLNYSTTVDIRVTLILLIGSDSGSIQTESNISRDGELASVPAQLLYQTIYRFNAPLDL